MLWRLRQETLIVVERRLEAFQALEKASALDQVLKRARLEQNDSIERCQPASPIRRVEVNELQVAQHPSENVPRAARFQHRRIQLDRLPVDLRETRANLVERENFA